MFDFITKFRRLWAKEEQINLDDAKERLRHYITRDVAAGYVEIAKIANRAAENMVDDFDVDELRPLAKQILDTELANHLAAQRDWPTVTDCDRLEAAFAELEQRGIMCRQNFTCCGTCGVAAIVDLMEAQQKSGTTLRGYAFFHEQDTECAVDGSCLYLNYGSDSGEKEAAITIGREIVESLRLHGLDVHWDGTIGKRIAIVLDWKRRTTAHGTQ